MIVYSIGHSNQRMETFLELLHKHSIRVLIDVRSYPYSRYVPHFNGPKLAHAVGRVHIQYHFMGKELGGRPDGDEFYDADDHVLYSRVAESPLFLRGIERLEEIGRTVRVAIMCSEENPAACHRHLLIGRVLAQRKINLLHIRSDGQIQTTEELTSLEEESSCEQLSLLNEQIPDSGNRGTHEWRSLRPVLRKKQQPNSSGQ
jgi:uncharacterized protein (DUF488 family)